MRNPIKLKEFLKKKTSPNELERKLALLIINTEEPFILVDPELTIVSFNNQFAQQYLNYFGIKIEKGYSILNFVQKGSADGLFRIYARALRGESQQLEFEINSTDNDPLIFLLKYKPAYDEDGRISGVFVSSTEITEVKRAQRLVIESENRFRSIINNANDIIYLTDKEGKVIYISPAIERVTGFSPEEIIGKSALSILHPNHLKPSQEILKEVLASPGVTFRLTSQFLTKKGDYVWVEGVVTNLLHDPHVRAITANYHDITHIKQAEEKLRQNEERLKIIIDNEPECVKVVDLSGNLLDINPAGLKMLEADSLDQIKGQKVLGLIHSEDKKIYQDIHRKSCEGEASTGNFRAVSLKKNTMWMETNSVPLRNHLGEVYAVLSVTRDVTERKKTQDLLERNEKRYRTLVENVGDAIAIIGIDGKQNYVSPSIKKLLGYSEEEALQLDMFSIIHPEDREPIKKVLEQSVANPGIKIVGHTGRIKHKNGSWRWCESVVTNLFHDPFINGIVNNFRDITDKILSEKEKEFDHTNLHALINNTDDLIWSISKENKLISSNRAFDEMIRHMSGNTVTKGGDTPTAGFPEEQLKKWEALYARAFSGESFTTIEHTNFQQEHWSEISFYPIRQDDKIIGTACYSRNITERKLSEKKLEENNLELLRIKKELEYKELRLKQAQEIAHVGHWEVNFDTNISKWSDEAYRIYGLKPNEYSFSQEQWRGFIHPDDREEFELELKRTHQTLGNFAHSHRIIRPDGTVRSIVSEGRFEFDNSGKPVGLYGVVHDITKQKDSEKKLQESHTLLKKLTDKVPVAVYQFEIDKEGKMTFPFMSKAIEQVVPDSNMDNLGQDATTLFRATHPEDMDKLISSIEESRVHLNDWSLEFRVLLKDNSIRWLQGFSKPEAKENGTIVWYGYLQDSTERKLAAEEIRNAKVRYDFVAKATNDSIYDWDLITDVTTRSGDGLKTLFGYDPDEASADPQFWVKRVHPEDIHTSYGKLQILLNDPNAIYCNQEYRFRKADGTYAYVYDKGFIIRDANGKALRMIGATQDITKSKEAEFQLKELNESLAKRAEELAISNQELEKEEQRLKLLESIITNSNDAVMVTEAMPLTEPGPRILYVNKALLKMTGYKEEEILGNSPRMFQGPKTDRNELNIMRAALENKQSCSSEIINYTKSGKPYWVNIDIAPVADLTGKVTHMIAIEKDITSRKLQEQEREKLIFELIQNNKDLRQFSYITSHNLRGPIANLLGLTNLLDTVKIEEPTLLKIMEGIKKAATNFDETIKDLATVLNIKDRPSIPKEDILIAPLYSKIIDQYHELLEESNARITFDFSQAPSVNFNKAYLESILSNLITNAIKYRSKSIPLYINATTEERENEIFLRFKDNGTGIDLELHKEKIFGLYQRFHQNTEGKGLGLFLVKSQMQALNGSIEVESKPGVGTLFILRFKKTL